jgi:hypothetical protein
LTSQNESTTKDIINKNCQTNDNFNNEDISVNQEPNQLCHNEIVDNIHLEKEKSVDIHKCNQWILQFDGASKDNLGISGIAALLYNTYVDMLSENTNPVWCAKKHIGIASNNNVAEYSALLLGLDEFG